MGKRSKENVQILPFGKNYTKIGLFLPKYYRAVRITKCKLSFTLSQYNVKDNLQNNKKERKMIVCWFSCGAASACAAKLTIEKYGKENVRLVNNPVANEHPDNVRFLHDCEQWLGGGKN